MHRRRQTHGEMWQVWRCPCWEAVGEDAVELMTVELAVGVLVERGNPYKANGLAGHVCTPSVDVAFRSGSVGSCRWLLSRPL